MLKLMNKKLLGKKGFTLAELLVVIAILAILIAIAIPVFSHMVADANLRVNQANVRSLRSAAVADILTHMGDKDSTGTTPMNQHIGDTQWGWVATAKVDNNGNITDMRIWVAQVKGTTGYSVTDEISAKGLNGWYVSNADGFAPLSDDVRSTFATLKPSMGESKTTDDHTLVYYVQAVITDLDLVK